MKYLLYNTEYEETVEWTVDEILAEINRDWSDNWINYDHSDWLEGLLEFTDFVVVDDCPQNQTEDYLKQKHEKEDRLYSKIRSN